MRIRDSCQSFAVPFASVLVQHLLESFRGIFVLLVNLSGVGLCNKIKRTVHIMLASMHKLFILPNYIHSITNYEYKYSQEKTKSDLRFQPSSSPFLQLSTGFVKLVRINSKHPKAPLMHSLPPPQETPLPQERLCEPMVSRYFLGGLLRRSILWIVSLANIYIYRLGLKRRGLGKGKWEARKEKRERGEKHTRPMFSWVSFHYFFYCLGRD